MELTENEETERREGKGKRVPRVQRMSLVCAVCIVYRKENRKRERKTGHIADRNAPRRSRSPTARVNHHHRPHPPPPLLLLLSNTQQPPPPPPLLPSGHPSPATSLVVLTRRNVGSACIQIFMKTISTNADKFYTHNWSWHVTLFPKPSTDVLRHFLVFHVLQLLLQLGLTVSFHVGRP